MEIDEILRRLSRMTKAHYEKRPNEVTKFDIAKFFDADLRLIRRHHKRIDPISKTWQIRYSHFFALLDAGKLAFDPNSKGKRLIHVTPKEPPKTVLQPKIDFTGYSPMLKWDR